MSATSENRAPIRSGVPGCPFPTALNTHAGEAQEGTVRWTESFGLCTDAGELAAFRAADIGRLAARNHPDLSAADLRLVADWYSWLFLLDDARDGSEHRGGHPVAELASLQRRLVPVLLGARPDGGPFARALADLADRLFDGGREAATGLVRAFADHLAAGLWEAGNRSSGRPPSLSSYLEMRPLTGGLQIVTEIVWVLEGGALPRGAVEHPVVARATRASHNAVCWANDLLSLRKELAVGEVNNLVVVLARERGLSLESAAGEALSMYDREVGLLAELLDGLTSSGVEAPRCALERYADLLRNRVRGVLDWSRETARYGARPAAVGAGLPELGAAPLTT